METKQDKRTYLIGTAIFIIPTIIMAVYAYASRMPYLLNTHNMWVYFIVTLAIILVLFVYMLFYYRWKDLDLNIAMMQFSKKNKAKGILCGLFLSVILVWMSWGLVGLGANLFSREPYFELFTIDSLQPSGRKGWDVKLVDTKNKIKYSVTVSSQYMNTSFPWKEGEVVCAKGRTSFFGAIIEDFNAGQCKLDGFRLNQQ